ncbi:hypothetical protein [Nocardia panacis]|uniref:hypothetical protein n=1 Tax=Nocardia panacis TaxID=2340916 RepID=UPI0013157D6D|nr:hypothetical protein [Nocardia panacis]
MATRSVPQPPFSAELLADLHADNLAPQLRADLLPEVERDPEALRILRSLDDVTAELRALGREERVIHPMPADVQARLAHFLDSMAAEEPTDRVATVHRLPGATVLPVESPSAEGHSVPPPAPIDLTERRGRRLRWLAATAAGVAVLACAALAISVSRSRPDSPPIAQQPTTQSGAASTELTPAAALTALGRHDVTGPLGSPAALTRCVRAAGYERTVLGSTNWTYRGGDAVLILLTGPNTPKITALVVGIGCTTGDPQTRYSTDIG